jgi:hypothetical protein
MFNSLVHRMELAGTIPRVVLQQAHANSKTFEQHLVGTKQLLGAMGMSEIVQLAGLYHSVYGTVSFKPATILKRARVVEAIGELAERLVWLFCNCDRRQLFSEPLLYSRFTGEVLSKSPEVTQLIRVIEVANLQDQKALHSAAKAFAATLEKK